MLRKFFDRFRSDKQGRSRTRRFSIPLSLPNQYVKDSQRLARRRKAAKKKRWARGTARGRSVLLIRKERADANAR